nr:hypothetical protein [Tanacetum cinerariifolium]
MDTTIDQQVARDEALVPHAKRLRIGRSNFRLLSDIKSKESTLQLVYDVLRATPPKPKASVRKTRSSSDTTITPLTVVTASDEEEFIHLSLSTHTEEETRDEESFDPILKTPEDTDNEGNGKENLGINVGREEGHDEEEEEDELYRDVNINQGRDRGSKRRKKGKDPESASAPKEKATRSIGKSTQGSKS